MQTVTITISEELATQLEPFGTQLDTVLSAGVRELKLEQSLVLFKQGHLSLWKAARLANVSLREMIHSLYLHNIRPEIDEQLIQEELA